MAYPQNTMTTLPTPPIATSTAAPAPELSVISVTSRIPDFWREQPRLWFAIFKSAMASQKQGDDSKYHLVVSKLGKEEVQQVSDIILNPPNSGKFDALRSRLLQVFEESENRQLQKLMDEMDLGDQRPTQLLRRMRELSRNKIPDDTLSIMWQRHLPSAVRAVLTVSDSKDLDTLASIADKVIDSMRPLEVAQVSSEVFKNEALEERLLKGIDRLTQELCEMRMSKRHTSREQDRQRRRSPSRSFSRQRSRRDDDWICWYHQRFGEQSTRCTDKARCTYKAKRTTPPSEN